MTKILMVVIAAYFLGNFSPSYLLGKIFKGEDIREKGSKNAGSTNALRVFGKKIAIVTFILDIVKGVLAVWIGKRLFGMDGAYLAGLFVVIGHNWPILLGFRGGKGIATTIGVMIAIQPLYFLISCLAGVAVIYITRYVSLGSITIVTLLPICALIFNRPFDGDLFSLCAMLAIMGIYQHRKNIERLRNGNENKLKSKK
ncbi:MAG: glycerol-3-phosphate 1-O-acyltransferase PlsY [Tissierellales bacterium]|nr:glycerol-3-phosphate 1-O-acyltransferase PlsY [Tissierellales bacterium]